MIYFLAAIFALLPTYLLRFKIGPLPTTVLEVLIWVLILAWLARGRQNWPDLKNVIKNNRALAIAASVFLLGATISTALSPNLRAALGEWRAFYVEPIIVAVIIATTVRTRADWQKIAFGLIIGGTVTAALAVYQHFTGWLVPHSFWANRDTYRVTGWYGFPNGLGLWLAMLVPVAGYLIVQKNKPIRLLAILYIPLALAGIIFAKSTAGLMGVAAAIGVVLLAWPKTRWLTAGAAMIAIAGVFLLPATSPIKQELLAQNRSGQLRRDMWGESIEYLKIHPLRGAGLAAYSQEIWPFRHDKRIEVFHHPHNIFLTMWINTGLLGLIGFVSLLVILFGKLFRPVFVQRDTLATMILAILAGWVMMGLVDSPYIKNDWSIFFWALLALTVLVRTTIEPINAKVTSTSQDITKPRFKDGKKNANLSKEIDATVYRL